MADTRAALPSVYLGPQHSLAGSLASSQLDLKAGMRAFVAGRGAEAAARRVQVNQAMKQRRRTYRAHGRINPYMCSPSHIELILMEKGSEVPKEKEEKPPRKPAAKRARDARRALLTSGSKTIAK